MEIEKLSELAAEHDVPLIIDNAYGTPFPEIVFAPAAPVFDADRRPLGAVGITGPSERLPVARQEEIGPRVAAAARALSRGEAGRTFD